MSADHKCDKGEEIAIIKTDLKRLIVMMDGTDGNNGLASMVTILCTNISSLTKAVDKLVLTTNELMLYKSETDGFIKAKTVDKADKIWIYGIVVTLIGIIITLVIVIAK